MAETDTWPLVVCDAGPLIHLDEIDCLELLTDFRAILVPEQVKKEVLRHRPTALQTAKATLRILPVPISAEPPPAAAAAARRRGL
jgi:predicted nucleic acid-binding protein